MKHIGQKEKKETMNNSFSLFKNKRGQIQTALMALLTLGIFLVIVGYILAFGQDFQQTSRNNIVSRNLASSCGQNSTGGSGGVILYTACPLSYNITVMNQDALATTANSQGTVATVGLLVVVVGLLVGVIGALGFAKKDEGF